MPDKLGNYSRDSLKEFVGNADLRSLLECVSPIQVSFWTIEKKSLNQRSDGYCVL